MINIVELEGGSDQPVHCPFCGEPLEYPETVGCRHHLYLVSGDQFHYVSDRVIKALSLPKDPFLIDPYFGSWDERKFGTVFEIIERADGHFVNMIEFQVDVVSDITHIGFANLEEELYG